MGRVEFILKWSSAFLLVASLLAITSLVFTPFSAVYLGVTAVLGLAYTVLTLICWRLEDSQPLLHWLVLILTIILITQGRIWAERSAFAGDNDGVWGWRAMQYASVLFGVFFAALFIFKGQVESFLFSDSGSSESPI